MKNFRLCYTYSFMSLVTRATTWSASRHFCLVEQHLIVVQQCSQVYGQEYPDKLRVADALYM